MKKRQQNKYLPLKVAPDMIRHWKWIDEPFRDDKSKQKSCYRNEKS